MDSKTKNDKKGKNEFENFSNELLKKIGTNNKPKKNRTLIFRSSPILLLITVFLLIFVIFGLTSRNVYTDKISLDQLLRNVEDNKYSQLIIQNDSRVIANGKSYLVAEDNNSLETQVTRGFEIVSLQNLGDQLKSYDVIDQIRTFFGRSSDNITEIVIGDDFIVAKRPLSTNDLMVKDTTKDSFNKYIDENNINLGSLGISVSNLKSFSTLTDVNGLTTRVKNSQIESIWNIDGQIIAKLRSEFIDKSYIDWAPSVYSFTDLLQNEGISLTSENLEVIPNNVPSTITFDDILTVFVLVGFVVLGIIIFRGAQSSGMGIMQFGQSKAKIFFGSKTDTTFKDVAGINEAREELNEIVDFLKNPNKFRKLGARIPKGILMVGAPGTGKTLLARAIAGEAGVPFFHTSGSEFEEMLVGAGASRVRDLFSKAKKAAPSLIFIDEIDAVARKRGTRIQSGTTEQTLNQILVEMDGFEKNVNVIVLAATNRPDVLDPAILRPGRFDRQVRIEVPDADGRKEILTIHGKNKPFDSDVDLEKIAKRTVGFTGADLENILNEAAIIAAKEGKQKINMDDIEEAVSKVILGPAKRSRKRTQNELKLVAYHEAGHAVVSKFTPNSTPVDKISITSRGNTGGVTMFLPETDEYIMSKNKLVADITVGLGGRAAEEVALDDISTGASNDIEKATTVAKRMVQKFGMSKKLGLVQYGDFEEDEYLGYAYSSSKEYSDKTAESIDSEVKEIIDSAYTNALKILNDKRDVLDRVANALLEKEVLSKEEFESLV